MSGHGRPVAIVRACLRDGRGGSPTAVLDEAPSSDTDRRRVPVLMGTSHAVFVSVDDGGPCGPVVSLRFFTARGELPACGHGTVAALALLAARARVPRLLRHSAPTRTGRVAARMFAPSIGVPEDVANANSTACLAAHLSGRGVTDLTVDMGDSLGSPSTITATTRDGPSGPLIHLGGSAQVERIERLP